MACKETSSKPLGTFGPFDIHFHEETAESTSNNIKLSVRELEASQFFPKSHSSREYSKYSGCMIWDASVVLARFIFHNKEIFKGKIVLELGSGCGVAGMLVSHFCSKVAITDYIEPVHQIISTSYSLGFG